MILADVERMRASLMFPALRDDIVNGNHINGIRWADAAGTVIDRILNDVSFCRNAGQWNARDIALLEVGAQNFDWETGTIAEFYQAINNVVRICLHAEEDMLLCEMEPITLSSVPESLAALCSAYGKDINPDRFLLNAATHKVMKYDNPDSYYMETLPSVISNKGIEGVLGGIKCLGQGARHSAWVTDMPDIMAISIGAVSCCFKDISIMHMSTGFQFKLYGNIRVNPDGINGGNFR